jgi:hypothetical protein
MKTICTNILLVALASCTARTVSPPLSGTQRASAKPTFAKVSLSSGHFRRPHRVIGVFQMTQAGYKWFHEVQIVDDANPDSLLYKIGRYASSMGAQGVQNLELVDLQPQSDADRALKQINSAINIQRAARRGDYGAIAREGSETRWEVRGELVVFLDAPGADS